MGQGGLIRREQPGPVSFDWAADGHAWLDACVCVFRVGHVLGTCRIQRHLAEGTAPAALERIAFEVDQHVAAPRVGAALGHDVDHSAGRATVLGGIPARLHLDFIDELRQDRVARHAREQVGGLDAVDQEAILRRAGAVDGDAPELRLLVGARRLTDERREIAALRQQVDGVLPEAEHSRALACVDQRRGRRDLDLLGDGRNLEHERQPFDLSQEHLHAAELERRETRKRTRDVVIPRGERGEAKGAAGVGDRRDRRALLEVQSGDRGARDRRALRVPDRTLECAALLLRRDRTHEHKRRQEC